MPFVYPDVSEVAKTNAVRGCPSRSSTTPPTGRTSPCCVSPTGSEPVIERERRAGVRTADDHRPAALCCWPGSSASGPTGSGIDPLARGTGHAQRGLRRDGLLAGGHRPDARVWRPRPAARRRSGRPSSGGTSTTPRRVTWASARTPSRSCRRASAGSARGPPLCSCRRTRRSSRRSPVRRRTRAPHQLRPRPSLLRPRPRAAPSPPHRPEPDVLP